MPSKKSRKSASPTSTERGSRRQGSARRDESYRPAAEPGSTDELLTPLEHYRREKARRTGERRESTADPLEEARREYRAMLAADAAKQKGGRPKKNAAPPAKPAESDDDVSDGHVDTEQPHAAEGDAET